VATEHCDEHCLTVLWLSDIASILVDSCINRKINAPCSTSIARWLCSLSTCLDIVYVRGGEPIYSTIMGRVSCALLLLVAY